MRVSQLRAAVAIGAVLTAAGCASGSASPTVPSLASSPAATVAPRAAGSSGGATSLAEGVAYARCMRSSGVSNFPDPVATPSGGYGFRMPLGPNRIDPKSAAWVAAQEACKSLLPPWWTGPQLSPAQQQAWLDWAKCIRSHGAPDFADPRFSGSQVQVFSGGGSSSPEVQSAMDACKSQMPSSGGLGG